MPVLENKVLQSLQIFSLTLTGLKVGSLTTDSDRIKSWIPENRDMDGSHSDEQRTRGRIRSDDPPNSRQVSKHARICLAYVRTLIIRIRLSKVCSKIIMRTYAFQKKLIMPKPTLFSFVFLCTYLDVLTLAYNFSKIRKYVFHKYVVFQSTNTLFINTSGQKANTPISMPQYYHLIISGCLSCVAKV